MSSEGVRVIMHLVLILVLVDVSACVTFGSAGTVAVGYLGGDTARNEGWLQLYVDDTWVTVCNRNWTRELADYTCRTLGFDGVQEDGWDVHLGEGTGPSWCLGPEEGDGVGLTPCLMEGGDVCSHSDDVGLKCVWEPSTEDFMNRLGYMFRLTGPSVGQGEGRIEVFINDEWGTICSLGWTEYFADAVCKHLGYRGVRDNGWGMAAAEAGSGPVMCADIFSLDVCPVGMRGDAEACTHSHDVALRCDAGDDGQNSDEETSRDMEVVRLAIVAAGSVLVAGGVFLILLACSLLSASARRHGEDLENLISSSKEEELEAPDQEAAEEQGVAADDEGKVNEGYEEVDERADGVSPPPEVKGEEGAEADSEAACGDYEELNVDDNQCEGSAEGETNGCKETSDETEQSHDTGEEAETCKADDNTTKGEHSDHKDSDEDKAVPAAESAITPSSEDVLDDGSYEGVDVEGVVASAEKYEFSMHGEHSLNSMYF